MRPVYIFLLLAAVAALGLLGITSSTPHGPTGFTIAPATHYVDGSEVLIKADVLDAPLGPSPVKITVLGDLVYKTVLVDGEEYSLLGDEVSDEWYARRGTIILRLEPGEHVIHGYSCLDEAGWKCGCLNEDNCNNWMSRTVLVE